MWRPDFIALYRCKKPYNLEDTHSDNLAWIRQEECYGLAKSFSLAVSGHERYSDLKGDEILRFDDLLRPFLMASQKQRKLLMQRQEQVARRRRK